MIQKQVYNLITNTIFSYQHKKMRQKIKNNKIGMKISYDEIIDCIKIEKYIMNIKI